MSVYGPKIELPEIGLPEMNIDPKAIAIGIAIIVIIVFIALVVPNFVNSLDPAIEISWKNNPLDLKDNPTQPAELNLTLINNTKDTLGLTLEVTTISEEIIIFCPFTTFSNVEAGQSRKTTCLVRRNPDSTIFTGTYNIKIKTNLEETQTTLEVRTK